MTDQQMERIKVAVAQVMSDMVKGGILPTPEQRIEEGKVSTLEALRDAKGAEGEATVNAQAKQPSESISFKDLPAEGKVQMAQKVGIDIDEEAIREQEAQQQQLEQQKLEIQAKKGANRAVSK